jgi:hypothetical protein
MCVLAATKKEEALFRRAHAFCSESGQDYMYCVVRGSRRDSRTTYLFGKESARDDPAQHRYEARSG